MRQAPLRRVHLLTVDITLTELPRLTRSPLLSNNAQGELTMMRLPRALLAIAFLLTLACITTVLPQAQTQTQAPRPARSRTDEMLDRWNDIGNKLVAMAQDFREDKYDYTLQQEERTFAQNLLHVAAVDYDLMRGASGSNVGPDFGKNKHNPSRDVYKTKADVVKLIQQAVSDGAELIEEGGDAGLDKTTPFGWETGRHVVHNSYIWWVAIEHSGEHLGQLVVYYRADNRVPPESRR